MAKNVTETPKPRAKEPNLADLVESRENDAAAFKRAVAGLMTLVLEYRTLTNQLNPGEKGKKPSIITHRASLDGKSVQEVVVDIGEELSPDKAAFVLHSLAKAHYKTAVAALVRDLQAGNDLYKILESMEPSFEDEPSDKKA